MLKNIITILVFNTIVLGASFDINQNVMLKYLFTKGNQINGMLVVHNKNNTIDSKYYNITKADKLPFFSKKKDFTYEIIDDQLIMKKLNNDGIERSFIYNLSSDDARIKEMIELIGIASVDVPTSSILLDQDLVPDKTSDKMPVLSIESMLVALAAGKLKTNDPFYLLEPQKKIFFKVGFISAGNATITINGRSISTKKYLLKLKNSNKKLVNVYLTQKGTPVRFESSSKKWAFNLSGAGQIKEYLVSYKDTILNLAKKKISKSNHTIMDHSYSSNSMNHIVAFDLRVQMDRLRKSDLINRYIDDNYLLANAPLDNAITQVSVADVIGYIEKQLDGSYSQNNIFIATKTISLEKTELLKEYARNHSECQYINNEQHLLCNDEVLELDDEQYLELVIANTDKEVKSIDVIEDSVNYSYEQSYEYSFEDYSNTALTLMSLNGYIDSNNLEFDSNEQIFYIALDMDKINKSRCNSLQYELDAKSAKYVEDNQCDIQNAQIKLDKSDIYLRVVRELHSRYPDMKWLNTDIKKVNDYSIKYNYLQGFKGIGDAI